MSVRQAIRKVVCKLHSRRVDACVIFLLKVEAAVCGLMIFFLETIGRALHAT